MAEITQELEKAAIALQGTLKTFAKADLETREKLLPSLLKQIADQCSESIFDYLADSVTLEEALADAIAKTTKTKFKVGNKEINPWTKGHTVVALKDDGTIVGMVAHPTEEYGSTDLTSAALMKAVCALHLNKTAGEGAEGFTGGLSTEENMLYLKKLGFTKHDGATANPSLVEDQYVFLGVSGAKASQEYLDAPLDEGGHAGPYTFAGEMDKNFAEITKRYLADPNLPVTTMPQPKILREMIMIRD